MKHYIGRKHIVDRWKNQAQQRVGVNGVKSKRVTVYKIGTIAR